MERHFEKILVEQCAPTLAGVKPASLFRYSSKNRETVLSCSFSNACAWNVISHMKTARRCYSW